MYLVNAWDEPSPDYPLDEDNTIRAYLSEEDANKFVDSCKKTHYYPSSVGHTFEYLLYGFEYTKDYMDVFKKELF